MLLLVLTLGTPNLLHAQSPDIEQSKREVRPAPHAGTTNAARSDAGTSPAPATHPARKRAAARARASRVAKPAIARPAPAVAAAPPKPNWPAEQPPNPAKVTWDSHGLLIDASNSSLDQILHEVATDTGVKLQGLNQDERIFGTYGPGPARDVLSRLLDGSGYNVLMIGGQGDEPPQQIILSKSAAGTAQPAAAQNSNNGDDGGDAGDQQPAEPAQPLPMPLRSPFGGPPPTRTPQEIQQEMLIRQQQIEQQQQQLQQQIQRQQQQQQNPQL